MDPDPILLLQRHASLFGDVSGTLDACSFAVESLNQMHLPKNPLPKIPTEINRSRIWIEFKPQGERDQEGRFHYFTSQGIITMSIIQMVQLKVFRFLLNLNDS